MKITNKNFAKKARDIIKLTHDEWYVDELEESKVMKWTEVEWIKNIIDRGYSVTFKKEGSTMENKNNNSIWSPQQEKVINELKTDINQINQNISKILEHLKIK